MSASCGTWAGEGRVAMGGLLALAQLVAPVCRRLLPAGTIDPSLWVQPAMLRSQHGLPECIRSCWFARLYCAGLRTQTTSPVARCQCLLLPFPSPMARKCLLPARARCAGLLLNCPARPGTEASRTKFQPGWPGTCLYCLQQGEVALGLKSARQRSSWPPAL